MNAAQGTIGVSGLTATDQGLAAANQWLAAQNQQLMTMLAAPLHALGQWPKQHVQNSNRQNSRHSNSTWNPPIGTKHNNIYGTLASSHGNKAPRHNPSAANTPEETNRA